MMKKYDKDNNNQLDLDEFTNMYLDSFQAQLNRRK